jgi:DNA-binding NtrC family response regulator
VLEERILIVGGDNSTREALACVLAHVGRQVRQTEDATHALRMIRRFSPQLVIVDADPPGTHALNLIERVLSGERGVGTLLMSNGSDVRTLVGAKMIGTLDVLWKPINPKAVRSRVDRAFESRRLRERCHLTYHGSAADEEPRLIGRSTQMLEVLRQVVDFASTNATVLIVGATGTGKELAARSIHHWSARRSDPFIAVNCAAVPSSLLESELFGHVRGAFTGAGSAHTGRFEQASGGTIFLDEIGEATLDFQAKLLRVLQDGTFSRVGGETEHTTNARVIAATNQDLAEMTRKGGFRRDLLYRLAVAVIHMPPLCEHLEDMGEIVGHLLPRLAVSNGLTTIPILSDDAMDALRQHHWPGNVRELANCLERGVVRVRDGVIYPEDLQIGRIFAQFNITPSDEIPGIGTGSEASEVGAACAPWTLPDGTLMTLKQAQTAQINEALRRSNGNVNAAARLLGVPRGTLRSRMGRLAIQSGGE